MLKNKIPTPGTKDFKQESKRLSSISEKEEKEINYFRFKKAGLLFGLTSLATSLAFGQVTPKESEKESSQDAISLEDALSYDDEAVEMEVEVDDFHQNTNSRLESETILGEELEDEVKELTFNTNSPLESPFEDTNIDIFMQKYDLDTLDLILPGSDKILLMDSLYKNLDGPYTTADILPIFTPEVYHWADLVVTKVNQHNLRYPEYALNPNYVLAIISIESQGTEFAKSDAGARGLMQVMGSLPDQKGISIEESFRASINIDLGLEVLTDCYRTAKHNNMEGTPLWEYVAMKYNGWWNADKFFKTNEFYSDLKSQHLVDDYISANSIAETQRILDIEFEKTPNKKPPALSYGPGMVKAETLDYRNKMVRFALIAEIASYLRFLGYSDSKIKQEMATPEIVQRVVSEVNSRLEEDFSYFDRAKIIEEVFSKIRSEGFDFNSLPQVAYGSEENPANFLLNFRYLLKRN